MSNGIPIYDANATDFSTNGRGLLFPQSGAVEWTANGAHELELEIPIDEELRWTLVENECILKAPVPMRESPYYEDTAFDGEAGDQITVTREIYKVGTQSSRLRLRARPTTGSAILGAYPKGTEVVKLANAGSANGHDWVQVTVRKGGATGYMAATYLTFVRSYTETVKRAQPGDRQGVSVQPSREQLFRIYAIDPDTTKGIIHIKARHIFYDLAHNIVNGDYSPDDVPIGSAAQHAFGVLLNDHNFRLHVYATGNVTGEYGWKSFVEALLGDTDGMLAQVDAILVVDNYDIFILPGDERDMGVTVRRGKNLNGVKVTHDISDVVTRIIPVGKDKNGDPLYLSGTRWVDSPHTAEYAYPRAQKIEYDVRVGDGEGEYPNNAQARAKLRELAQADFEAGLDQPEYALDVDLVMLQDMEEYPDYAGLQSIHGYDTVTVIDEIIHMKAKVRMTYYKADILTEKYLSVTLGDVSAVEQAVSGSNIMAGSISGNRLIQGSVDGSVLRNLSVQYAKISLATIEKLTADSLTAIEAHIHELVAGSVTTDQLYADLAAIAIAELTTANIQKANIDWAQIKNLTAEIARITEAEIKTATITAAQIQDLNATVASIADARIQNATITAAQIQDLNAIVAEIVFVVAGSANFDLATIKNLLSNALVLEEGLAGSMMITNLAVTSANLLNATIGKLVIKGEDGKYYAVMVGSDGVIHTQPVEVTEDEIAAGETEGGMQIVEETINAQSINGQTIKAQEALFNTVLTAALNAGKITANDAMLASATIPMLYATAIKALGNTLDISANESIQLIVGEVEAAQDSADSANTAAKSAQSTADSAQQTAEFAKVYDSAEPPSDTPEAGKLWLDRGVTPPVMRRWRGADVPTGRDFETATEGNPLIVSSRGQVSEIAVQARCIAQQAGSGDPSPENIRAISGRESVTVQACGKNLFQRVKDYSSSGVTVTVAEDGKVTATGTAPDYTWVRDAYGVYNSTAPLFTAAEDTPVTLSGGTAGVNVAVQYITASGVRSTQYTQGQSKKTFTLPAGASLVRQYIRIPANTTVNGEIVSPQMELGSTATEYEPYRDLGAGEIAPASPLYGLAGAEDTVEISVDGSVQAVHRTGMVVIDGDQYAPYNSAYTVPEGVYAYTCPLFNTDAPPIEDFKGLCSHFRIIPRNAAKSERVAGTAALGTSSPQWGQIWFFAAQPTAAEFNAWLAAQVEAGTPVTLAYERAAPQVETLEAAEPIAPQKGDNVLFTDADSLSATLYGSGWETVNDTEDIREGVSENADALYSLSSEFTQTREAFEFRLNQTVNREEQSQYMRYGDGRLELGQSNSRYTAEISPEGGFVVKQEGAEMASMRKNTVSAPVLEARRLIQMGGNTIKLSTSGGLIFN